MTSLQDWNPAFPIWPPVKLTKFCATMDEAGLDLLEVRRSASQTEAGRQAGSRSLSRSSWAWSIYIHVLTYMYVFVLTPTVCPPPTPMNAYRAEAGGARPQGPDIGQGRVVPPALRRGRQAAVPPVRISVNGRAMGGLAVAKVVVWWRRERVGWAWLVGCARVVER